LGWRWLGRKWGDLHVTVEDYASKVVVGYGWHNETFHVAALQSSTVDVLIVITATYDEIKEITHQCLEDQSSITFQTTGELGSCSC
jgi:hypothetical protein